MRDDEVPNKTDAGRDEIQSRALKLPNVLRSILLMVDGQRNVGQLRGVIGGLKGPDDALAQLEAMGLIAVPQSLAAAAAATIREAARPGPAAIEPAAATASAPIASAVGYSALYTLMSDTVREHLGLRGYFLQLKVERCSDVGDLLALLPDFHTALGKARDVGFAMEMERRFRSLAEA
ncbi:MULTISPECIES: hypothetical protein [unclassified Lysobacter]|uniref:hypothetical protein n=1 Tax=unclassified Lysobacter TaxID=2635362 RepID=UPI001C2484A8|nr:hypothetical protein [Lysobacter sp. MMG2]MBU8975311.1 hypothetical protein [Lysobacter sp. MMG2]